MVLLGIVCDSSRNAFDRVGLAIHHNRGTTDGQDHIPQ